VSPFFKIKLVDCAEHRNAWSTACVFYGENLPAILGKRPRNVWRYSGTAAVIGTANGEIEDILGLTGGDIVASLFDVGFRPVLLRRSWG